jgi:ATP-citrate lyase beta-subunit
LIEPQIAHTTESERYIALSRQREGVQLDFSRQGGIHVEAHADDIQSCLLTEQNDWSDAIASTGFTKTQLQNLVDVFNKGFMSLLEINPYIVEDGVALPLDVAIEVDDAGSYFTDLWSEGDFRYAPSAKSSPEELIVRKLDEKSPSSLKLEMINPDGSIFLLLSGGGASVVVADEVYNLGFGEQLANYGEYSGNPNIEETYIYTLSLLKLLVASKSPKKVLFIGGAVANFTDIANTFEGIIKAIDELSDSLGQQEVKIYVRRGGPRQEIGLARIEKKLKEHGLLGAVYGPAAPITSVVAEAMKEIA